MANIRKPNPGLNTDTVRGMLNAWHHAVRIRQPLNRLISIRPIDTNDIAPTARADLFARLRNKLGVYARSKGFTPTFIWSREINTDGSGEHLHVLMHVPRRYQSHFETVVTGWYPGPAETDIRAATQTTLFTSNGKRHSAIGYICKQMTPQAWYRRGLSRKRGGQILGKRGGMTKNLDWKARAAFRDAYQRHVEPRRPHETYRSVLASHEPPTPLQEAS